MVADPQTIAYALGFVPARLNGLEGPISAVPVLLTPLTSAFAHSGLLHIAFNLILLLWCGTAVERVLGTVNFIIIFIVGAYAAAFAQYLVDPLETAPMIGASGAISAVVGAFALSFGRARRFTRFAPVNRAINSLWLLVAWVVLQLMIGWLAGGQGYAIATAAHVGGFVAGLAIQRPLLLWRYRTA